MSTPKLPGTKTPKTPSNETDAASAAADAAAQVPGPKAFSLAGASASGGRIPDMRPFKGSFWVRIKDFDIRLMQDEVQRIAQLTVEVVSIRTPTTTGVQEGSTMGILFFENIKYRDMFRDQIANLVVNMFGQDPSDESLPLDDMMNSALSEDNPTRGFVMKVDVTHSPAKNKDGSPKMGKDGEQLINKNYRFSGLCSEEELEQAGIASE